jgi:hypothetical protein
MAIGSWADAPQIRPSDIRVGDVIGSTDPSHRGYTVKMISAPQTQPGKWTFFGRDDSGLQHTNTYRCDELVRRYARG